MAKKKKGKARNALARRYAFTLTALVVVLVVCIIGFTPLGTKITQGLDIQGGLSVVMDASHADGSAVTDDDMDAALNIIQTRVNSLGASEATVQKQGTSSILVQIPGMSEASDALNTIGSTGQLEFVDLRDITDSTVVTEIESGKTGMTLEAGTYTAFMTGDSITNVSIGMESQTSSNYAVDITLNSAGASEFDAITSELVSTHGLIAIVLDGVVQSAPAVQSEIPDGKVQITGNYDLDEAKALKAVLESGALPVTLTFSNSQVVGPTLGQESLTAGILAALIGLALVAIYLIVFYRGLGILTALNLAVFAVLYLGILALLSFLGVFALSLAGMAGIVLTIGMAADSSILVLERFKEELRMGRSIKASSITGVRHAIGTSIDADLVTFVSAAALFLIAVGSVRGFGLTLGLGIICDIATMLAFKAPIIRLLAIKQFEKHTKFWGIAEDIAAGKAAEAAALEKGAAHA